ncbi:MAG: polysaccharide biosynthesis/export family protein [Bacteroidia bacterium]|jgi:polysaccharide export outer membrane protein|nr:polysaccharide biosynthesis/export family protein [Bacteroidia bacterium]MCC6767795.1 polysaccharide biosynthesis/export family protein [Bacteroidia bacterium]
MKNQTSLYVLLLLALISLGIQSCVSRQKMVYFQHDEKVTLPDSNRFYSPKLRPDDLVGIFITASDPATAMPFNPFPEGVNSQPPNYANGVAVKYGYLIDAEGNIEFPVLGKLQLEGLTRAEASNLIKDKLKAYLQEPIVTMRILNFKVTILGDVRNPGTFNVPNERLTLPEALGLAGDLNMTGLRNNLLVIREQGGVRKSYRIDLTSNEIFTSPVYFLQQNDVIYVEPNQAQRNASVINNRAGIWISLASLIVTTIILIVK